MNFTTLDKKEPIDQEYYLVKCTHYCESGFQVAQWDKLEKRWTLETGHDVTNFVTEHTVKPLSDLY